jgi:hypothetical protein
MTPPKKPEPPKLRIVREGDRSGPVLLVITICLIALTFVDIALKIFT